MAQPVFAGAILVDALFKPAILSLASYWTDPPKPSPQVENRTTDLALDKNGATATSDSEYAKEPGCAGKVIDGVFATPEEFSDRWHSSLKTPHPDWIEVHLAKPAKISHVVIHFADPADFAVSFEGTMRTNGHQRRVVTGNREPQIYRTKIAPVTTDAFRLTIYESADKSFPNAAQLSEIELY